mmetsp:Transcript_44665/g.112583  ORF Transcript_44665/g.112583 Transcript_44665/m.112583 type:complete len:249 (+) Transcript_44665:283-1029(+)
MPRLSRHIMDPSTFSRTNSMMWLCACASAYALVTTPSAVKCDASTSAHCRCVCAPANSSPSPRPAMSRSASSSGSLRRMSRYLWKIISNVSVSSLNQIMPQRDTVASVAYLRSCTSNITRTLLGSARRSPLGSVRILLSSSTLFRFSTHSGSTSPSKMIQCRICASPRTLSMILRRMWVNRPSVHSRVVLSRLPNSSSLVMALGSMTYDLHGTPSCASRAARSTDHALDLPLPDGPTIITPWQRHCTW